MPTVRVRELAEQFRSEVERELPVSILPDGNAVYKDYVVKQNKQGNWIIYNFKNKTIVDQFFLKTCALMGAKAYSTTQIEKFFEIKRMDNSYWANHSDTQVYKRNIKLTKDYERYLILLNKLEDSQSKETYFKEEISKMFKWTFV
jgi:hypothetical protein